MRCDKVDEWLVGAGELLQQQPACGIRGMLGASTDGGHAGSFVVEECAVAVPVADGVGRQCLVQQAKRWTRLRSTRRIGIELSK